MTKKMLALFIVLFAISGKTHAQQDKKITAEEYVTTYKDLAIAEMKRTGIPASITLAQGLLESGMGNSPLAKQANNHFGIKCKTGWTGKSIKVDDDELQECFRAYDRAEDSYKDHSDFLYGNTRYAFLFKLEPTDYKSWAYGLKQAGYATNPKYPDIVIANIEKYSLYQYDIGNLRVDNNKEIPHKQAETKRDIFSKPAPEGDVIKYNNIPAYEIKAGDTYNSIANAHGMMRWELRKYNDLQLYEYLTPGTIIYLKPKHRKAKEQFHIVKEGEGMYSISQLEGIKLRLLYKWNRMKNGDEPATGEKLNLRHKRETPPQLKPGGTQMSRKGIYFQKEEVNQLPIKKKDSAIPWQIITKPNTTVKIDTAIHVLAIQSQNIDGNDTIGKYHVAGENETVYEISRTYNLVFADLIEWNHISGPLHPGQKVYLTKPFNYIAKPKSVRDKPKEIQETADTNKTYTVKPGETLYSISKKINVPVDSILIYNKLQNHSLSNGQVLIILSPFHTQPRDKKMDPTTIAVEYHIVTSGETLYSIAKKYNVTIPDLITRNGLSGNSISVGQKLQVKW